MATIVNDGLSRALYEAILRQRESYIRTGYLSTTSAIDSARVRVLEERHDNEIVVNASTYLPSYMGTCVHRDLENYTGTFEIDGIAMEKEFVIEIGGIKFSGRPDWYSLHDEEVGDFKTTGVWTIQFYPDGKPEHLRQANVNGYLIRQYGYPCTKGWVELIFMDWKKSAARHNRNYPRRVERIRVEKLDSDAEVEKYMLERIALHLSADKLPDNELPLCSEEEQWKKSDVFALIPRGAKNAIRGGLCKSEDEAIELAKGKRLRGYKIEHRPGEKTRCEFYCNVRAWCNQYVEERANVSNS